MSKRAREELSPPRPIRTSRDHRCSVLPRSRPAGTSFFSHAALFLLCRPSPAVDRTPQPPVPAIQNASDTDADSMALIAGAFSSCCCFGSAYILTHVVQRCWRKTEGGGPERLCTCLCPSTGVFIPSALLLLDHLSRHCRPPSHSSVAESVIIATATAVQSQRLVILRVPLHQVPTPTAATPLRQRAIRRAGTETGTGTGTGPIESRGPTHCSSQVCPHLMPPSSLL
jgi:hypothetical protein